MHQKQHTGQVFEVTSPGDCHSESPQETMVLAANGDEFLSVIRPQFAKHLYGARSPNSSLEEDGTLVYHVEAEIMVPCQSSPRTRPET